MAQSSFEKSKNQIRQAREEIADGICCECGGIMRETDGVYLCPINPNDLHSKFVDKYAIQCDKCGKKDFFVVKIEHM
jgi:hypothetical protein